MRLLFACLIGLVLLIPLMMVKGLVADRQQQAQTARDAITSGWGGSQVLAGPVLVVPFRTTQVENVTDNGKPVTRVSEVEKLVYISPVYNEVHTTISPEARSKSIYRTVVFTAQVNGHTTFNLPKDLAHFSVTRSLLIGSVVLFIALAGTMYATRRIDWSAPPGDQAGTDEAFAA